MRGFGDGPRGGVSTAPASVRGLLDGSFAPYRLPAPACLLVRRSL